MSTGKDGPDDAPPEEQTIALPSSEAARRLHPEATVDIGADSVLRSLDPEGDLGSGVHLRRFADESAGADAHLEAGSEHGKYVLMRLIGEGGMGNVYLAHDRDLKRSVALKVLRPEIGMHRNRFLKEAQVLAQLEHPNIVPLHELGVTAGRHPYSVMRYVRGKTLAEVIAALRQGDPDATRTYSLTRLVQIFLQIAQAVDYAHARGVVHRDLKPANVMLGEHGEVQVLDWGLAKVVVGASVEEEEEGLSTRGRQGVVMGTPAYMAPEQAMGKDVNERADVYALGVILYELLTLERPFAGKTTTELLVAILSQSPRPPRERAPGRPIPEALEELCLKALSREPGARPATARVLHDAVQSWLEEEADRARRKELADERTRAGRARLAEYQRIKGEVESLSAVCQLLRTRFRSWQPVEEKAELYRTEDRIVEARERLDRVASQVVTTLTEALGFDPEHAGARLVLADYYWDRFKQADHEGDGHGLRFFGHLLAAYDDGRHAVQVQGDGSLGIDSIPPGARVRLYRMVERQLKVVPEEERLLGPTPVGPVPLPMGSYLAILSHPGYRDMRYPIFISRNKVWQATVRLYTDQEVGEGFVHVPAGPYLEGGDPDRRVVSLPRSETVLGDYFIGLHPVTMEEYLAYLNDIGPRDPERALRHHPRRPHGGSYLEMVRPGHFRLPPPTAKGPSCDPRWPVFGVSWFDAQAYCEWRSQREGRVVRLPSESEWEKAARGVDGRYFPWGNRFDPSLCNMQESLRERPSPVVVDAFPTDVSVYGMRGAGGNMRDWTLTEATEGEGERARATRVVRGGAWVNTEIYTRCASRYSGVPALVIDFIGFRVVREPRRT